MVFRRSLNDSKSTQVSRTLLNILTDHSNAVARIVSICPPNFNSSSSLSKPPGTLPCVPITISITVSFIFHGSLLVF